MSAVGIYNCRSCQAPLRLRGNYTNVIVCPTCKTPQERRPEGHLQANTGMAVVTETLSGIIKSGSCGVWKGKSFEITGRTCCFFDESVGYYWTGLAADGEVILLKETCGQLSILEKVTLQSSISFSDISVKKYNSPLALEPGIEYIAVRTNNCWHQKIEGELWRFSLNNFCSKELVSSQGHHLEMINFTGGKLLSFRVHEIQKEDLQLTNTVLPGDTSKSISCRKCQKVTSLSIYPFSQSFSCSNCGARHSLTWEGLKMNKVVSHSTSFALIPNAKGTIDGIAYNVTGCAEKEDESGYRWREYTLFNIDKGFAFLSEYDGNWIFVKEELTAICAEHDDDSLQIGEESFVLYNQYHFKIVDCIGEFAENIFNDNGTWCKEFISPPVMWIREASGSDITWYSGKHISNWQLEAAFKGNSFILPSKRGMGSIEPIRGFIKPRLILIHLAVALILYFVVAMWGLMGNRNAEIYENTIYLWDTVTLRTPVIAGPFELDKWRSDLLVEIEAPVKNDWFEASFVLVNKDNGNEIAFEKGVEFYDGIDGGEYWSEGSTKDDILVPNVPKGNYLLQIYSNRSSGSNLDYFKVKVNYDVPIWRNFFLFGLFLIVPPLVLFFYFQNKENIRWQNSPFGHNNEDI